MENNIFFSLTIPTYNSEKTFETTLKSIMDQTYKNYEIVVVDHESTDKTVEIAQRYGCRIFNDPKKLLNSRAIALRESRGDVLVIVCSDIVLEKTLLERMAADFNNTTHTMQVLEEGTYNPTTWVHRLTAEDKKNTHIARELDPSKGVLMPRAFRIGLLREAFAKIPPDLLEYVTVQDHAIMYYECWKLSRDIGYIPNAMFHMDPGTLKEIYHHYFRWGQTAEDSLKALPEEYNKMFEGKLKNRVKLKNFFSIRFLKTLPIIFMKGFGYTCGRYHNKFKSKKEKAK